MYRRNLLTSIAVSALCVTSFTPDAVAAQERLNYNIPSQDLGAALRKFAKTSKLQVIFDGETARGKRSSAITIHNSPDTALKEMLNGTGLTYQRNGKIYIISPAQTSSLTSPYLPSALMGAAAVQASAPAPQYEEIIVTAQKKEERLRDVPIAISAFSAEDLDDLKIEGGSELLRSVPNVTFSKTNFASYNFSIRGIGTKALSVSSDPAVAISYNYVPLIRNRLFEQEYFDVERIEVLRGPQGTLYGRNATGGVVNMISNKPTFDEFSFSLKGEVGNYASKRLNGHINIPLADTLSLRFAGAFTDRDGYDFNTATQKRVNGRHLWSTRLSASYAPSETFQIDAVWEHFNEDDDRSRTGKQLCTKDPGPDNFAGKDLTNLLRWRGVFSQGCLPKSIYTDEAYDVPNAFSLPHIWAASGLVQVGILPTMPRFSQSLGLIPDNSDPYEGITQSKNLREIATTLDPKFRASNEVILLNIRVNPREDISINLTGSYSNDKYYSFQDYNRFNSEEVFRDTSIMRRSANLQPNLTTGIAVNGILIDPQLGSSNKILAADTVKSNGNQYYAEIRSSSGFAGPLNYNMGLNYLKFKVSEDYYVFSNLFTAIARTTLGSGNNGNVVNQCDGWTAKTSDCTYVDPNPLNKINGNGHNYFRSINISTTESKSIFGEIYYKLLDDLKLTIGTRYTSDEKNAEIYPTQLLLGVGLNGAGVVNEGYFRDPDVRQRWKKLTGRAVLDWKPDLKWSDETLIYASYARGYKGGGANPPRVGVNLDILNFYEQEREFLQESVNAFEIGTKNSLLNRRLDLNFTAFFFDYNDYQVSQIVDRSALNENFDALIFGAELETKYRVFDNFNIVANLGYLKTRVGNNEFSIDVMNRTQGNKDWVLLKPWMQMSSNCIAPRNLVEQVASSPLTTDPGTLTAFCPGRLAFNFLPGSTLAGRYGFTYNPETDAPNFGRGFEAHLKGNELPNSPRWTFNLAANYLIKLKDWNFVVNADYYRQGKSWARVYNTEIDRLKSWSNANISLSLSKDNNDFQIQVYVKNLFNKAPITDMFINSDDSGLTANVFSLDPRIAGLSFKTSF